MLRINLHGTKDVQAIKVLMYVISCLLFFETYENNNSLLEFPFL